MEDRYKRQNNSNSSDNNNSTHHHHHHHHPPLQTQEESDVNVIHMPANEELLPEEELIRRQEWSCYGWTEVDYLMLKNVQTGEEHV
jgi:hypothetical protein